MWRTIRVDAFGHYWPGGDVLACPKFGPLLRARRTSGQVAANNSTMEASTFHDAYLRLFQMEQIRVVGMLGV